MSKLKSKLIKSSKRVLDFTRLLSDLESRSPTRKKRNHNNNNSN
jgi:hypothetical protein